MSETEKLDFRASNLLVEGHYSKALQAAADCDASLQTLALIAIAKELRFIAVQLINDSEYA